MTETTRDTALRHRENRDLPDSPITFTTLDVGESLYGRLDEPGDADWVRVELRAGDLLRVGLNGRGGNDVALLDPVLRLYDADGDFVAMDDDGGDGADSEMIFSVPVTGTYYLEAAGHGDGVTGQYRLRIEQTELPAYDPLDTIDWGTSVDDPAIAVYFAEAGEEGAGFTAEAFTPYEIGRFRAAFDVLERFADIAFFETDTREDADFVLIGDADEFEPNALGQFGPPGTGNAGIGVFNTSAWDRQAGGDLELGGYGFFTILHELLHGLGLAHPHDAGGGSEVMPGVTAAFDSYGAHLLNQGLFTAMSYNPGFGTGSWGTPRPATGAFGLELTPMALDIALLQRKYGANTTTNAGDTLYRLPMYNENGIGWEAIWDAGGEDTISYGGDHDARIDLRSASLEGAIGGGGYVSAAESIAGGFLIASGAVIENAHGGAGHDTIIGNTADNLLIGGWGNDRIEGKHGDDEMIGGAGADRLIGGAGDDHANGGSGQDRVWLGGGADSFEDSGQDGHRGHDRVTAGGGRDVVRGDGGNDWFWGDGGADRLSGGAGSDRLRGGRGDDTIGGGAGDDRITGDAGADALMGGHGDDRILGGTGSDDLRGGRGDDRLSGGRGVDTFVFRDHGGDDVITDYNPGADLLALDAALTGGLAGAAAVAAFARVTGEGVLFDFGADTLLLEGLGSAAGLAGDILLV